MIPFRKKLQLSTNAAELCGSMRHVWKFLRKYPTWLSKTYLRIVKIAENKEIDVPEPKTNMEVIQ